MNTQVDELGLELQGEPGPLSRLLPPCVLFLFFFTSLPLSPRPLPAWRRCRRAGPPGSLSPVCRFLNPWSSRRSSEPGLSRRSPRSPSRRVLPDRPSMAATPSSRSPREEETPSLSSPVPPLLRKAPEPHGESRPSVSLSGRRRNSSSFSFPSSTVPVRFVQVLRLEDQLIFFDRDFVFLMGLIDRSGLRDRFRGLDFFDRLFFLSPLPPPLLFLYPSSPGSCLPLSSSLGFLAPADLFRLRVRLPRLLRLCLLPLHLHLLPLLLLSLPALQLFRIVSSSSSSSFFLFVLLPLLLRLLLLTSSSTPLLSSLLLPLLFVSLSSSSPLWSRHLVDDLIARDLLFDKLVLGKEELGAAVIAVFVLLVDDGFAVGAAAYGH